MNWITVKEMSARYGVSRQCIYAKIDRKRYKLGDHIREEYGHDKLLDEDAVELLKPKSKTVIERKKQTDKLKDALMSCEEMCSENAGVIKALSDEFREFKEQILQEISNIRAAVQKDK